MKERITPLGGMLSVGCSMALLSSEASRRVDHYTSTVRTGRICPFWLVPKLRLGNPYLASSCLAVLREAGASKTHSQAGTLAVIHKSLRTKNAVIPAGIAEIQKPWRANSSQSKCLILVICSPQFHIPVDWIPAIPAGMTAFWSDGTFV